MFESRPVGMSFLFREERLLVIQIFFHGVGFFRSFFPTKKGQRILQNRNTKAEVFLNFL